MTTTGTNRLRSLTHLDSASPQSPERRRLPLAFVTGATVGLLGGLIGLGGAEFRLPLLMGPFAFPALEAVIVNKALSLIVVGVGLPSRAASVPWSTVGAHWSTAVNLLAGSLVGAWFGAGWATRMRSATLARVIAILLLLIAGVLLLAHDAGSGRGLPEGPVRWTLGLLAGTGIGAVAALLGVAGGELLIPTLVLLFGLEPKLAGSLSLAVSFPTMLVAFSRYSRDRSFSVLRENWRFLGAMASGSVVGSILGGRLLGLVPTSVLLPMLAALLAWSAIRLWRHEAQP